MAESTAVEDVVSETPGEAVEETVAAEAEAENVDVQEVTPADTEDAALEEVPEDEEPETAEEIPPPAAITEEPSPEPEAIKDQPAQETVAAEEVQMQEPIAAAENTTEATAPAEDVLVLDGNAVPEKKSSRKPSGPRTPRPVAERPKMEDDDLGIVQPDLGF